MAQKYYNSAEAAELLGVDEADIKQMVANRELHGYRDGANWKFKVETIDELVQRRAAEPETGDGDVLLSEVELGSSDPGASGTVIGMEGDHDMAGQSDLLLDGEEVTAAGQDEIGSKVMQFEELDLSLDDDLTLEETDEPSAPGAPGSSTIDLTPGDMDDDDLVLGGSGTGSDITIGGDSGISLVDPTDSGLSLDEPLDLGGSAAGSGAESLELGEDDLISLSEDADEDSPTELKTDGDFLLTPMEEAGDEDDSESGSQVIALDTEGEADDAATMIGAGGGGGAMAAMLDEDLSAQPADELGIGDPLDAQQMGMAPAANQPGGFADGAPVAPAAAASPEAPYSGWNILSLVLCVLILTFCGMFMTDLLWNMWSWDSATSINSWTMDWVLSLFEG